MRSLRKFQALPESTQSPKTRRASSLQIGAVKLLYQPTAVRSETPLDPGSNRAALRLLESSSLRHSPEVMFALLIRRLKNPLSAEWGDTFQNRIPVRQSHAAHRP